MSNDIYIALEYFFVYAFLGWCVEVIFQAVAKGLIINRGFLNGPVCPIYGCGVIVIFRMLEAVGDSEAVDVSAECRYSFRLRGGAGNAGRADRRLGAR